MLRLRHGGTLLALLLLAAPTPTHTEQQYVPLHAELFDADAGWRPSWFHPDFLRAVSDDEWLSSADNRASFLTEVVPGVYSFEMFTQEFCELLLEELANYAASGLPRRAPNSMNNYGLIVNEIGMRRMIDRLQSQYLLPLTSLFPADGGDSVDFHHSFVVQYKKGEDLGLDIHHDDSDVTLNICLGQNFTGSGLVFCGMYGSENYRKYQHTYTHRAGRAIIHSGRHRHGADNIDEGARYNLIIWNKSKTHRNSDAANVRPRHWGVTPDVPCLSWTHDEDFCSYHAPTHEQCTAAAVKQRSDQRQRRARQQAGGGGSGGG